MGDVGDMYKLYRDEQKKRRRGRLATRTEEIKRLSRHGFTVIRMTDFQYRIRRSRSRPAVDIYPIHNRYHDLGSGKRGSFRDLKKFIGTFFGIDFEKNKSHLKSTTKRG